MRVLKKSIKDLVTLFNIALKEEVKLLLDEYNLRLTEDGAESATKWFEEEKAKVELF